MNLNYKALLSIKLSELYKHPTLIFCNFVVTEFSTANRLIENCIYFFISCRQVEIIFKRMVTYYRTLLLKEVHTAAKGGNHVAYRL